MNTHSKASLLANLLFGVLVVGLIWQLARREEEKKARLQPEPVGAAAVEIARPRLPASPAPEKRSPAFHWSQLESSDYRTYIANLRGIGCPEQTIRDIITADLHSLYAAHRTGLTSEADSARLAAEEASVLAALLGPQGPRPELAQATPQPRPLRGLPPEMPLVFQGADLASLPLTAEQSQVIARLQQTFRESLETTSQDPNDPAYRSRWQAAQAESDSMLRGLLGQEFYLEYEQLVANQASSR